jgi:uncharacterized protein YbjQ (UPF0145 family)
MPPLRTRSWGAEYDRIAGGGLASSTEARLKELVGWGGFSSFMTPAALAVAGDADIEPIGQVVGMSIGQVLPGYVRTTRPGQGRMKLGVARWREHTGLVTSWTALRRRALARLTKQATTLGANAVVGITAVRELEASDTELPTGQMRFAGTAVRLRSRPRDAAPVLTLASAQELWAMLRAGLEPVGIAGAFACVETMPSTATVLATAARRRSTPNVELEDLTESVYEVRRLAMERLVADARSLKADGLLGVELKLEGAEHGQRSPMSALTLSVHVLASAVRRAGTAAVMPDPVFKLSDGARG